MRTGGASEGGRAPLGGSGGPATLLSERGDDVRPALLVALEGDDLLLGRLFEQLREGRVAVVRLVEGGVLPEHSVLNNRDRHSFLVLALEGCAVVGGLRTGMRHEMVSDSQRR